MAAEFHISQILGWTSQPAFWVTDGIIRLVSAAVPNYLLSEGMPVSQLLKTGQEEYAALESGRLFLSLQIGEQEWDACIHRMAQGDLFLLESTRSPELRAMSLAAMKLREPLAALMSELEQLAPELSDGAQAGRMNRRVHQMLRIVGNMSAAGGTDAGNMELREVCGFLEEIFDKTAVLAEPLDIQFDFAVPNDRIYTEVDADKLERAVYNMLSNAMKAASGGGKVTARVQQRGKQLLISVTDSGDGIAREVLGSVYTRYLREPGLEPPDRGIGLGMSLITAAARLHGGTVLLETPREGGTRVTLTLAVKHSKGMLRSSSLPVDYTGSQDHALVELSDVLTSAVYEL